jgi:hypothetical protein
MADSSVVRTGAGVFPELSQAQKAVDQTNRWDRRKMLIGFLIVVILLVPFNAAFERAGPYMDEGSLLVYPELIGRGAVPYRDFETFYGPANIYVLAATYSLFGTNVIVERAVGLLYRALILSLLFALIARWNVTLAGGCTALAAWLLLLEAGISAYAWFGGIACLLASLWLMAGARFNTRFSFAGLLGGCAVLYRADLAPAVILSALPLLHLAPTGKRVHYSIGIAAGLLPFGLLTWCIGVNELINNLFLYPVFYSNPARHLPMSTVEPYVRALFIMHLLAAGLNIIAGVMGVHVQPADLRRRLLLSLALLAATITAQAAQRLDLFHLTCAAFLAIGILPLSLLALANCGGEWRLPLAHVWLATIIVCASVEAVAPEVAGLVKEESLAAVIPSEDDVHFVQHAGRSFPCPTRREAVVVTRMLDWLEQESASGQRLFVGPSDLRRTSYCDTFIYHLMPTLRPNGYFLEMNPLSANRPGSRLADDISSSDWLVLDRAIDAWKEENRSLEFQSDLPNQVVSEKFQLAAKFGPYLVFHRKS